MPEQSNIDVQYDPVQAVYILRLAGTIDAHTLNEAANALTQTLTATHAPDTLIMFLLDVRKTVWDLETTHTEARHILGNHLHAVHDHQHAVAVLTTAYAFHVSASEALFTDEDAAVTWLQSKRGE